MRLQFKIRARANNRDLYELVTLDCESPEQGAEQAIARIRAKYPSGLVSCHGVRPPPADEAIEEVKRGPGRPRKVAA